MEEDRVETPGERRDLERVVKGFFLTRKHYSDNTKVVCLDIINYLLGLIVTKYWNDLKQMIAWKVEKLQQFINLLNVLENAAMSRIQDA